MKSIDTFCDSCGKPILNPNSIRFCNLDCARHFFGRTRYIRQCDCGKLEYVANKGQLNRQCRSCSKAGNTFSQNRSIETRKKISEAKKGSIPWNKGKTGIYSQETRLSMGRKNLGRTSTLSENLKKSKSLKQYYSTNTHHAKGRTLPSSHKKKISNTIQNWPEEFKGQVNECRAETAKITYWSKSKEERERITQSKKMGKISFTNNDVIQALAECSLKIDINIPPTNDIYAQELRPHLICRCGRKWQVSLYEIVNKRTVSCGCEKSIGEIEIFEFLVNELNIPAENIQKNKRFSFLGNKELDIFIPELNYAIEYHGLSWHSEKPIFEEKNLQEIRTIHELKYLRCKENNITLVQIFEDEWRNKKDIIKSMLAHRLKRSTTTIYARKCEIRHISIPEQRRFFVKNHIAGSIHAIYTIGLYYKNELVTVLSLRKPYTKKPNTLEIARFASALNYTIVGGFQKLLKKAEKLTALQGCHLLLSYSDCRFGTGQVYEKAGFMHVGKTKPNYFYEKNGVRENRFKHRKNNDPEVIAQYGNTEREQQNNQGWYAIYDAGSEIYIKDLKLDTLSDS